MRLFTAFLTVLVQLLALVPPAPAQVPPPTLSKKQAGFYRMQIGDFEVIALSDGTIRLCTLQTFSARARDARARGRDARTPAPRRVAAGRRFTLLKPGAMDLEV